MNLGALLLPSHPPEVDVYEGAQRDLAELCRLDEYGFAEAWIGEHFTASWEPCPAPDLLIAQALHKTKSLRLGPLGHLLPYHHPVELAHRVAYLDHMAQGRYQLGVGISALPTDQELFGINSADGTNRRMTFEALDIMRRVWLQDGAGLRGKFWSMGSPTAPFGGLGLHLRPYQLPYPPIAIAGLTPNSENLTYVGEHGYLPVSFCVSPDDSILTKHWAAVEEGARRSKRTAHREQWRVVRDVLVAPTNEEAWELAVNGEMGRAWSDFLLPVYQGLGHGEFLRHPGADPDSAVTPAYLAEHLWFVGSPSTVADKIVALQRKTGGFGYLLTVAYDYGEQSGLWARSQQLMVSEVLPRVMAALGGGAS